MASNDVQVNSQLSGAISQQATKRADRARKEDALVKGVFALIALICASVIVFITVFVFYKGILPFVKEYESVTNGGVNGSGKQSFVSFLTGSYWNAGEFDHAAGYLAVNTIYATLLSLVISVPVSILASLFIVRVAPKGLGWALESGVELLADIPSVIFGLFGMGVITAVVKNISQAWGIQTSGGASLLSGVIVLSMMSMPTMILMSVTAMKSVNPNLINASLALGATKTQTDFKIVVSDAQSGIFAGLILGIGRAMGEATAIQMVIGNAMSGPTWNPFSISATITTQMLMGIGEATPGTMGYDIRFSAGILLMVLLIVVDYSLNRIKDTLYARRTGQKAPQSLLSKAFRKIFHISKKEATGNE